jgi:hypothetical protein
MALKYTEGSVVWYYSYIFLLYNSSKCVRISAECLLQSLYPSVRPSIHSSFHLYAWNNSGIQYVFSWHLILRSCEEKHWALSLFDGNLENTAGTSYETWMPLCSHLQRHKHSYHPTRKRKKLLLFYTALRRLFFILIHCFNKWRNLSFVFLCFTGTVSIFSIPARHQNLEGCVRRDKISAITALISVWFRSSKLTFTNWNATDNNKHSACPRSVRL